MTEQKIAILGAGNLGQAIASGIAKNGIAKPDQIILTRRERSNLSAFSKEGFSISSDNPRATADAKTVILCVQPGQLQSLLKEIDGALTADHLVISVITGVTIAEIQSLLTSNSSVVRAMPNTAVAVGESMTCLSATGESKKQLPAAEQIFGAIGKTLVIEEKLMQAATVLGSSGIAFIMRYLRAAMQGGIQMGFDAEDAQLIAMQTAQGAASLLLANHSHPESEIDKVTTPKGCTITGLNEMEHKGFSSALIQGLMASFEKISEMKEAK